jgi:hypothetical protein
MKLVAPERDSNPIFARPALLCAMMPGERTAEWGPSSDRHQRSDLAKHRQEELQNGTRYEWNILKRFSHLLFKIFNVLLIGFSSKFRRARRGGSV